MRRRPTSKTTTSATAIMTRSPSRFRWSRPITTCKTRRKPSHMAMTTSFRGFPEEQSGYFDEQSRPSRGDREGLLLRGPLHRPSSRLPHQHPDLQARPSTVVPHQARVGRPDRRRRRCGGAVDHPAASAQPGPGYRRVDERAPDERRARAEQRAADIQQRCAHPDEPAGATTTASAATPSASAGAGRCAGLHAPVPGARGNSEPAKPDIDVTRAPISVAPEPRTPPPNDADVGKHGRGPLLVKQGAALLVVEASLRE